MAVQAAANLVMGPPLVAFVAGAGNGPRSGRVPGMAVKAADIGPMRSPGCRQRPHVFTVTLAAICVFQRGGIGGKAANAESRNQQEDSPGAA